MKSPTRRVIVNADDLGRTPGINDGIFTAHQNGIVTSATLMVIYPAAEQAAETMQTLPDLGVGLHVQLSGGTPLLAPETLPGLVDERGRFPDRPEYLADAPADQIRVEVQAQFERFCELAGRLPTHLDGHHHCHREAPVCEALIEVARRWNLPVRRASERVGHWLRQTGVATTDAFLEDFFGDRIGADDLERLLATAAPGTTELMCHPGLSDDELRAGSSYADEREEELRVLTHPEALAAVERNGLHLTHFAQL